MQEVRAVAQSMRGAPPRDDRAAILERMRRVEMRKREGLPRTRHGHVVESARVRRVFVSPDAIPAAIKDGDMVELQPLGTVAGQQQKSVLAPAYLATPLGQPFDHVVHRHVAAAGLQGVLFDGLPQQVVPATRRAFLNPTGQGPHCR